MFRIDRLHAAVLAVAFVSLVGLPASAIDYYLDPDGIKGNVTTSGFVDQVELIDFSLGATQDGCSPGAPTLMSLTITKRLDPATVDLLTRLGDGTVLNNATLTIFAPGGVNPRILAEYEFTALRVVHYLPSPDPASGQFEVWELEYGAVTVTYRSYDSGGNPTGQESYTINGGGCP